MSKLLPDATRAEWRAEAMQTLKGNRGQLSYRLLAALDHIAILDAQIQEYRVGDYRPCEGCLDLTPESDLRTCDDGDFCTACLVLDEPAISQLAPPSSHTRSSPDRSDENE